MNIFRGKANIPGQTCTFSMCENHTYRFSYPYGCGNCLKIKQLFTCPLQVLCLRYSVNPAVGEEGLCKFHIPGGGTVNSLGRV